MDELEFTSLSSATRKVGKLYVVATHKEGYSSDSRIDARTLDESGSIFVARSYATAAL